MLRIKRNERSEKCLERKNLVNYKRHINIIKDRNKGDILKVILLVIGSDKK